MIILAATVVISLSNTGIIDRAGKAVDLTNEVSVQDLAALTWADAYMNDKRGEALVTEVTTKLSEQGVKSEDWNITISDTGIVVTSKANSTPDVELIPGENAPGAKFADGTTKTWEELKTEFGVTDNNIPSKAFEGKTIQSIVIPEGVILIGNSAFSACDSLMTVKYLGTREPSVASTAFSRTSVTKVIVPKGYESDTFGGIVVSKILQ
jgi:hypothetical protein